MAIFGVGSYYPDTGNTMAISNIYSSPILDSAQDFHIYFSGTAAGSNESILSDQPYVSLNIK